MISYLEASNLICESEGSSASFLPLCRRRVVQIAAGESKKKMAQYKLESRDILSRGIRDAKEGEREGGREGDAFQLIRQKCQGKGRKDALVYRLAAWLG